MTGGRLTSTVPCAERSEQMKIEVLTDKVVPATGSTKMS
jgi:hypothetical protein